MLSARNRNSEGLQKGKKCPKSTLQTPQPLHSKLITDGGLKNDCKWFGRLPCTITAWELASQSLMNLGLESLRAKTGVQSPAFPGPRHQGSVTQGKGRGEQMQSRCRRKPGAAEDTLLLPGPSGNSTTAPAEIMMFTLTWYLAHTSHYAWKILVSASLNLKLKSRQPRSPKSAPPQHGSLDLTSNSRYCKPLNPYIQPFTVHLRPR